MRVNMGTNFRLCGTQILKHLLSEMFMPSPQRCKWGRLIISLPTLTAFVFVFLKTSLLILTMSLSCLYILSTKNQ